MSGNRVALDWKALIGFDQAGATTTGPALQAKVGDKGPAPTGILGRPQDLTRVKDRIAI